MQNPRAPVACGVTVATFWLCPGLKMLLTRLHMETLALWKGPRSTSGFGEYGRLLGACPATHTSSHRPGGMGGAHAIWGLLPGLAPESPLQWSQVGDRDGGKERWGA